MALWWLTFDKPIRVFLIEAGDLLTARVKASLHGAPTQDFSQGYELDAKTAKKVPKDMVGKLLSKKEAEGLLKKLG